MDAVVQGTQQQSQIPSSTYAGMQPGAKSALWMRCFLLWLEVASEVRRRGQLSHRAAVSQRLAGCFRTPSTGFTQVVPCHAVS